MLTHVSLSGMKELSHSIDLFKFISAPITYKPTIWTQAIAKTYITAKLNLSCSLTLKNNTNWLFNN
jgi:hypothetical protein